MRLLDFGAGFFAGMFGGQLLRRLFSGVTKAIQGAYKSVVDDTRRQFNENVVAEKFDMGKQIQSDIETYKRSKSKLQTWFKGYARKNAYKGIMLQGHLYYIQFYDPLTKDTLPFYDEKPLVLSFGIYLAKTGNLVQYGINLHMLPTEVRGLFLTDIFNLFKKQFNGEMYSKKPRKMNEFTWETLQSFVDKYHIDFAVRSYIVERQHGVVYIEYQDWGKSLALAESYVGTSEQQLRRTYRQHIQDKRIRR